MSYYTSPPTWVNPEPNATPSGFGFGTSPVNGGGGIGFGGPSGMESFVDANAPVMQAGLVYGQQVLQQEIHKSKQSMLPLYDHIRVYFCVDHAYVAAKLGLLFFPFIRVRHWTTLRTPTPASPAINSVDPYPSSTHMESSAEVTRKPSGDGASLPPAAPRHLIPLYNRLAFDLYIPLMSLLTYVVLSAFAKGLTQDRTVTSDYFLSICNSLGIRLALEVLCVVGIGMMKNFLLPVELAVLDVLALMSYKYVILSFETLVLLVFGCTSQGTLVASVYALLSGGFFTSKALQGKVKQEGGRGVTSTILSTLLLTALQVPSIIWAVTNPFALE